MNSQSPVYKSIMGVTRASHSTLRRIWRVRRIVDITPAKNTPFEMKWFDVLVDESQYTFNDFPTAGHYLVEAWLGERNSLWDVFHIQIEFEGQLRLAVCCHCWKAKPCQCYTTAGGNMTAPFKSKAIVSIQPNNTQDILQAISWYERTV